jgi:hypothetical protein
VGSAVQELATSLSRPAAWCRDRNVSIWPFSMLATELRCGVETSCRGDAGTAEDDSGS